MSYNENIINRLREVFLQLDLEMEEKNMFGGLTLMYKGKMCCGIVKDELMVRVIDSKLPEVLEQNYVRPMDFTKRPMKGFVFVEDGGFKTTQELQKWVELGVEHVENQLK